MKKSLLVEIGVEELPAIPLLKELPNIPKKWENILKDFGLESSFEFYYTPRRIVFYHDSFKTMQDDKVEELFGAPKEIAFKDGVATKAAEGFAKKCGITLDEITTIQKGNKEVLYYKKTIKGKESIELFSTIIEEFLNSLSFGKSMRWGNLEKSFIRPVRWLGVMLGDEIASFELYGVKSSNYTHIHRTKSYDKVFYDSPTEFFKTLQEGGVILEQTKREQKIKQEFEKLEQSNSIMIEKDDELLDEVIAITENPTALLGEFDKEFLTIPSEVIITSMKEHQRYFPVFKDGKLSNHFVVVSNALSDDFSQVVAGNEKVLRARLSDGMFFWENDLKKPLDPEPLKDVIFLKELGSIYDKELRESKIANYLNTKYKVADEKLLSDAVMLSKADLVTELVYEFTELQGLMGYYYAKHQGLDDDICLAIKEQYLPTGEDSPLPSTEFSSLVALSGKLDSLLALFSIGKIPTGTKDPFALRRAALGVIKIVLENNLSFDINQDLAELAKNYKEFDIKLLEEFFIERILGFYKTNRSLIKAVIDSGERDLNQIDKKIKALSSLVQKDDFKERFSTFKRVANIIKDLDITKELKVDENLFKDDAEINLYKSFVDTIGVSYQSYEQKLEALFNLKDAIDNFFDKVMVNDKDEAIKQNRKNLIGTIYKAFRDVADIKEISI